MESPFVSRHADQIAGVLSCFDRVVIYGTLPGLCHAGGMEDFLRARDVRLFDYPRFAEPLRDAIRKTAERVAAENGLKIEFVRRLRSFRKEERVAEVLRERGQHPGLVHIFSAMEECATYHPWHDKETHKTSLKPATGKCLHYYFYFIHPAFGLCYLRVPTWCPFRLQFYFNGHNHLAAKLRRKGIPFTLRDNAFTAIDDFPEAQRLADAFDVSKLHRALDDLAALYCPILQTLGGITYHWSIMQCEYATDVVFKRQEDLAALYSALTRTAIHAVKPDHVATFLGRKLTNATPDALGNDFSTRLEGTRIKHYMSSASIKLYDKFGIMLRIETTANDVTFFKHHRKVEQRDGRTVYKLAPVRKTIYSLDPDLRGLLVAANRRYLDFISDIDDPTTGLGALNRVAASTTDNGRTYKGFNLFSELDLRPLVVLLRGEFTISGLRNKTLRTHLPGFTPAKTSHLLKRLRLHGLIKKIGRCYKYYITDLGRRVLLAALTLRTFFLVPVLTAPS